MPLLIDQLVGLEAFSAHLANLGIRSRVVAPPPELDGGFFGRDKSVLATSGTAFDWVSVRFGGVVGPREMLAARAFDFSIAALPLVGTHVVPIQYHYVFRLRSAYPWDATRLVQKAEGFWKKRRVDLAWTPSPMGTRFAQQPAIMSALEQHLRRSDKLELEIDPKKHIARLVHRRASVMKYNLFDSDALVRFYRDHVAPELLGAFEQMVRVVRGPALPGASAVTR